MKNAYEILGISPSATDEEIRLRYHELMKKVHSDMTVGTELSEKKKALNEKKSKRI